jgi:hypothetical protein
MQTIKTTVNTTKHTLEPQEVLTALEQHARNGGFGPLIDPANDTVSAVLLPDGGAEVVVVNSPPGTSTGS